jgi:N-acetyl sugar amidotransferase
LKNWGNGFVKPQSIKRCTTCVSDNSAFAVSYDSNGQCHGCKTAINRLQSEWKTGLTGQKLLESAVDAIKEQGRGKKYDALIGLSGGIDSAYLAHVAVRELGLRVLAVHVDGGWNTSPAVHNIETMVRALDLDLRTHVVEWSEMADLQLAFLRSGVFNQDIPQDHAFFSNLYRIADEEKIDYFLSGVNFSSECVTHKTDAPAYMDDSHIRAIHDRFGRRNLSSYKLMSFWTYLWKTRITKRPKVIKPLDFISYNKNDAKNFLLSNYGWSDYGDKHAESRFTKFYQDIYLPTKFGYDKRTLHYSSLIVSGQMLREDAISELSKPVMTPDRQKQEVRFVAKKLEISEDELMTILNSPPVSHMEYKNQKALLDNLFYLREKITGKLSPR